MNKKSTVTLISAVFAGAPLVTMAADFVPPPPPSPALTFSINGIIGSIFGLIWPIVAAYVIFMFVMAGIEYFKGKHEDANQKVIWGSVGVVVILLAWSAITIIRGSLNLPAS